MSEAWMTAKKTTGGSSAMRVHVITEWLLPNTPSERSSMRSRQDRNSVCSFRDALWVVPSWDSFDTETFNQLGTPHLPPPRTAEWYETRLHARKESEIGVEAAGSNPGDLEADIRLK